MSCARVRLSAVALSAACAAACGDPASFADAGPGADAAQDGGGEPPDAGADGGGGDRGDITVHVASHDGLDQPDEGAVVYFTGADGAEIDTRTVGADGVVVGTGEDGGAVTVRHAATDGPEQWWTVVAVEVGDELYFGRPATEGAGTMYVTVPANAGAIRYHMTGPCVVSYSAASTAIQVPLVPGCDATRPLVAVADRGAQPDQYILAPEVTPADGAELTLDGPWIDPVAGPTVTVSGVSPSATTTAGVSYYAAGRPAWGTGATVTPGTPLTVTTSRLAGLGDGLSLRLVAFEGRSYVFETYTSPVPASTWAVDATPVLPTLSEPDWNGSAGSWTVEQAGQADALFVYGEQTGEKGQTLAEWSFVLPPDATSVERPAIPGAPVVGLLAVSVYEIDVVDGYDAYRPRAAAYEWRGGGPWPRPASYAVHAMSF